MKAVRRSVKFCAIAAAALMAVTARADVLEKVPSDALVVTKFNHLADTAAKVGDLMQTVGVTEVEPTLKDPMQSLQNWLNIGPGLDTKRDAAFVFLNQPGEPNKPAAVILVPVSDYKAFVGSLTTVRTEGDVTVVHIKDGEEDTFVADWGGYAALGPKLEYVKSAHGGLTVQGNAAKAMESQDVCTFFNFPAIKSLVEPKLPDARQKMLAHAQQQNPKMTDDQKKLAADASKQLLAVATRFLDDATGGTSGFNIGKEGITANLVVEFGPDTYLGKLAASTKTAESGLLAGLPKLPTENYIYYGGVVVDGGQTAKVLSEVLAPIMTDLVGLPEGEKLKPVVQAWTDALATAQGGAFGFLAPTAAPGQGSMIRMLSALAIDTTKANALMDKQGDLMAVMGQLGGKDVATPMIKTTLTPNAKTVGGVKFSKYTYDVNPDDTSMEATRAADGMSRMFGPDGAVIYRGDLDGKHVLQSIGNDDDVLAKFVDSVKADREELSDLTKDVDAMLPKKKSAVGYFAVDQFVTTVLNYAKSMGFNVPVQLPSNLPPIGSSFGADGSSLRYDVAVPTQLMQSLFQAGLQTYRHFNERHGNGV